MNDWMTDSSSLLDSSEYQNFGGADTSNFAAPTATADSFSDADWAESLSVAFGDESPNWIPSDFFTPATADGGVGGNYGSGSVGGFNSLNAGAGNMQTLSEQSMMERLGMIGGQIKNATGFDNKDFTKLGLAAIQGMAQGKSAKSREEAMYAARMNEIKAADQIKQDQNARTSASVVGLRPVGLVNRQQQQLKRIDGTPVYANGQVRK